mgnify:CR=1 FL=1
MSPWIIAAACLAGAGFIAWGSVRLGLRWPLLALAWLLATIALQLYLAARGREGFHDLAAVVAQSFIVLPALLGLGIGLVLARLGGHRAAWRRVTGLLTALGLLTAAGAAAATFLI